MSTIYRDTEFGNVIAAEFSNPDADVRSNRDAYDAIAEVPHRFDRPERMVMSACAGAVAAVLLMAVGGWL